MVKLTKNKRYFEYILNNLREQDLEEVKALWQEAWKEKALKTLSDRKISVLFSKDKPIAMGGFVPVKDKNIKIAVVWLLCSSFVKENRSLLIKTLKNEILKAEKEYDLMFNYIYKSNFEAKSWLKKLGFKFDNPKPIGLNLKKDFEFFYKVKKGVKI